MDPRPIAPYAPRRFGRRLRRSCGSFQFPGYQLFCSVPPRPARESRLPPLGLDDSVPMDEKMESAVRAGSHTRPASGRNLLRIYLIVLVAASAVYVGCMVSPPSLMDDVDAVQAQIARNMITSGDWGTARLDGVAYMEKAPLIYWAMAVCYKIFGVHDWSARIPVVLSAIALAWLTAAFGMWAF